MDELLPDWRRRRLSVAVSGGPDSTALLLLLDAVRAALTRAPLVLHVDHGLRPGSAAEARRVAGLAAGLGLDCRILRWEGGKPVSGIQAAARTARYALLAGACREAGATTLLLAHHLDDQAETLLHRIDRGTGPDGLAGMRPVVERDGLTLVRPLLDLRKAELEAMAAAAGVEPLRDPSNVDLRFARPRLRMLARPLAEQGVTAARLARLAAAMAGAAAALDRITADRVSGALRLDPAGFASLDRATLAGLHPTLRRRVVAGLLQLVGGGTYPPRSERLARLLSWLEVAEPGSARTLAGCRVLLAPPGASGRILLAREWRRAEGRRTVRPGVTRLWDDRFEIHNGSDRPVAVEALGEQGLARSRMRGPVAGRTSEGCATIPAAARPGLPLFSDLDGGMQVPHLSETGADPFAWIGNRLRVRLAPRVAPGWLIDRTPAPGRRDDRITAPFGGRQAS